MKDLAKSMRYEIEEKTTVDMNSVYYKWDVAAKQPKEYQIGVAIIEKEIIQDIKKAGLRLRTIEPEFVALSHLAKGDCAVIDFGHSGTRLMIFKSSALIHVEYLEIGGKTLTDKIAAQYSEPEEIKHDFGAVLRDPALETSPVVVQTAELIKDSIESLARSLKQTLRAVEVRENMTVTDIYFTGQGAKLKYLVDYLSGELESDIRPLNLSSNDFEIDDSDYAAACGAALDNNYLSRINFASVPAERAVNAKELCSFLVSFALVFQIFLIGSNVYVQRNLEGVRKEKTSLQAELDSLTARVRDTEQKIEEYSRLRDSATLLNQKTTIANILYKLPDRTPQGVSLTEILLEPGQTTIKGKADTYSDLGFFVLKLKDLGRAEITDLSRTKDFTVILTGP